MTDNRIYTHPSVLEGIRQGADWADPVTDPREIDWPARQAAAAIPFKVIDGRPVNPFAPTGIRYGRNEFGHWGEALMADAVVTINIPWLCCRRLLMVERADGHGWATPGGHVDPGERPDHAARRELGEETGLGLSAGFGAALAPRYVPDPRASDEAWAVTVPWRSRITGWPGGVLPAVSGADDARRAAWVPAATYADLCDALDHLYGGVVFPAHTAMLAEFLATPDPDPEQHGNR